VNKLFLIYIFLSFTVLAQAAQSPSAVAESALEKRVMAISEELRCLVCQNQTIADSHADLAVDLRNQVREMLVQGKSDKEVTDFMVQRYGDFVLYRPPVKSTTWLLWFGPFLLLILGIGFLTIKLRGRSASETLSEADTQRAAELLRSPTNTKETKETK
jgi:cytochrome c-type biogenesis protein CcmH